MSQHLFWEPELNFQKTKRKAGNTMLNFSQNTKSNPRQSQNLCALGWDIKIFSTVNVSESSALVTTTAPSTPRSTAHTEQGIWINFPKQLYLYNESFENTDKRPRIPTLKQSLCSVSWKYRVIHFLMKRVPARRDGLTEELGSSQDPLSERPGVMTFGSAYPYYYQGCRSAGFLA